MTRTRTTISVTSTRVLMLFFLAENIVQPLHDKNKTYYFHRRFRRVPNIDECELGDELCLFEANEQYKRDK